MMKKFLYVFLALSISSLSAQASSCKIPKGQKLKIGCTEECSFVYKTRLQITGLFQGLPVEFVDLSSALDLDQALGEVDGILAPGGADINPKYYLDHISSELREYTLNNLNLAKVNAESHRRDPVEYAILSKYTADDQYSKLPMLGICRGMQMMSVVEGIPLYLDIKTELGIPNRINKIDKITATQDSSKFRSLYGRKSFRAVKLHHQGLRVDYFNSHRSDYPNVKLTALSNEGKIAEAIEWSHRPAIGVQYHPERSPPRATKPIFRWFLNQACEYKVSSKDLL